MQTQQKNGQSKSAELSHSLFLSSLSLSDLLLWPHYKFFSVAVLFSSVQPVCYVASIKSLQYKYIDSGVNDSKYHMETYVFAYDDCFDLSVVALHLLLLIVSCRMFVKGSYIFL